MPSGGALVWNSYIQLNSGCLSSVGTVSAVIHVGKISASITLHTYMHIWLVYVHTYRHKRITTYIS